MTVYGPLAPKYGRGGRPIRRRTVKSVKKSCDSLWSQLVKARAGERCERCGAEVTGQAFHAHHCYGRSDHRLRFEPRNGVALCAACHRFFHNAPVEFGYWFLEHRSEDAPYLAEEFKKGPLKRSLSDYLALEQSLRSALKALERPQNAA